MAWAILNWIMSAIALTGTIINAERNKFGFVFWLISNFYMSIRFFVIEEYAQSALFLIYFLLAIKGIAVWSVKEKRERKAIRQSDRIHKYIEDHYNDGFNIKK